MSSVICFNLDQSKILSSGNGLNKGLKIERKKYCLTLYHTIPTFNDRKEEGFGKYSR